MRHPLLSGERRSCGALWGRDWKFTSTGSESHCRKKAREEPRPPRPDDPRGSSETRNNRGVHLRDTDLSYPKVNAINHADDSAKILSNQAPAMLVTSRMSAGLLTNKWSAWGRQIMLAGAGGVSSSVARCVNRL